jgi:hypothetical protein
MQVMNGLCSVLSPLVHRFSLRGIRSLDPLVYMYTTLQQNRQIAYFHFEKLQSD